MPEPKVYLPSRIRGLSFLFVGIFFAALGLLGLCAVGWEAWFFYGAPVALGSISILASCAVFRSRVIVDDLGIAKCSWLGMGGMSDGFITSWSAIESWLVSRYNGTRQQQQEVWSKLYAGRWVLPSLLGREDSFTSRLVLFKIDGKPLPVAVYDCEAWRPSFDAFVEDIRIHAEAKEVA
jgi:hypothetical protein